MNHNEFKAWSEWLASRRGRWTIDPIHNGRDRDFIAYRPDDTNPTKGIYVSASGPVVEGGTYEYANPQPTNGVMYPKYGYCLMHNAPASWRNNGCDKPTREALASVFERVGDPIIAAARELDALLKRQRNI